MAKRKRKILLRAAKPKPGVADDRDPPIVLPKDALHPECEVYELPEFAWELYSRHRVRQLEKTLGAMRSEAQKAINEGDPQAAACAAVHEDAIEELEAAIKAGDVRAVAVTAIDVGTTGEKLRCYLESPYVQQVKKTTQKLGAGAFRYGDETRQEVLARFDELQAAGKFIGSIERTVQKEFGISPRTLRTWRKSR